MLGDPVLKIHTLTCVIAILLASGAGRPCPAADAPSLTLYKQGADPPTIFIDLRATPPEKFAARELRDHLQKMIGRPIDIRTDYWIKGTPPGHYIAVGQSRFTTDLETSSLTTEQYLIDVAPHRLAIIGGRDRQRGVLYGVYEFLERLGVRWYRPEPWGEHIPSLAEITLPFGKTLATVPTYSYRSVLGGGFTRNAEATLDQSEWASLWALRNRLNGADPGSDHRYGGQVSPSFDHIYYQLIPVEQYFDTHPEYFCFYKGQRRRTNPDGPTRPDNPTGLQLCLSNRDLQDLFAQKLIAKAKGRYDLDKVTFSATPNDACPFCECDQCKAMDDPQDPTSMSNRVCAFTNIVAKKFAAAVPGARVSLNAYSSWTAPPTIVKQIEPNILIHLALINDWSDYTQPFLSKNQTWNTRTRESFFQWKKLGVSEIYTYEYWSGYGWPGPLPLGRTIADRLRAYRQFNVRGVYNETHPSWGTQGLELYLASQLLWHPNLNLDQELSLYYRNYYGPAERPMRHYHETLMTALENSSHPVFSGGRGMHLLLTPPLLAELGKRLAEARQLIPPGSIHERRLKGILAGHEFALAVCHVLQTKKQDGVKTPIPIGNGSYLKSSRANQAWQNVLGILSKQTSGDALFDITRDPPYGWYIEGDILRNDAFGYRHEIDLLQKF